MKYDDLNLKRIREIPIFDVCSKLGITLYGVGKITKRAKCWYHDDKHPSMRVNKKKNIYKCFVCGKGGDVIKLVQDYENKTFPEACDWLVNEFHIVLIDSEPLSAERYSSTAPLDLWSLATIGTQEGGKSNSSKLNSKLNNSETNSVKFPSEAGPQTSAGRYSSTAQFDFPLRAVEQNLPSEAGPKIAIVESEKTAIILSEKFPDFIWLSCGGLQMFKPELLEPLLQHRIIIFPDTDPQGEAFHQWTQVALDAQRLYKFRYSLRVSPLLEQHATPEQKEAKIDLVDFLFK